MFWKVATAAGTLAAAFLGWQHGGLATAAISTSLALLAMSSLYCYATRRPFAGVCLGSVGFAAVAGIVSGGAAGVIALTLFATFVVQALTHDLLQRKHSLERAFPGLAHFRRFAELIRPEIQQYWIEKDTEGKPANRDDRSFVYASSKNELNDISFGTKRDYHKPGQIHIRNHTFPVSDREKIELPPIVIGPNRRIPAIVWGRFGVGDMSFGSLGRNAVEALASGAGRAGILLSTGEGGLSPYHQNGVFAKVTVYTRLAWLFAYCMSFVSKGWRREPYPRSGYIGSGQIMFEMGTGKFSVRTENGDFDYDKYRDIMANPKVVASKIKLAQGAKPGGGGILPGAKVTPEIAGIRGIPVGKDCLSPNTWSEFNDVPSMMAFIAKLQEISGKPVGIKIVIGDEGFINEVAEWMAANPNQGPDFIHVDGGEGGTGAAPLMLADFAGQSILDALPLVDNVLRKNNVRNRVVLMSSGKVFNPAQLLIQLALGADFVFGARGFMFSLGCIQAMKCATGKCPTGVTTHHKWLQRALVPQVKYIRVANYAETMHKQLIKLLRVVGVRDTFQLSRHHLTIVTSTLKEMGVDVVCPYPHGSEARIPQTPPTFGLTNVPAGPPRCSASADAPFVEDPEPLEHPVLGERTQPLIQVRIPAKQ